jgi:signal transduction histidine kinase
MLFAWLALDKVINVNTDILSIASLLGALCLYIIKERYLKNLAASTVYLSIIMLLSFYHRELIILAGIPVFDFCYYGNIPVSIMIFLASSVFWIEDKSFYTAFFIAGAALFGYVVGEKDKNEKKHIGTIDEERRLRYNLELAQNELINSRKEIEHLTEIRERNRIAHEIHDNIGHSIAGVIFQLEGARRIINKDREKTEGILKLCSDKLTEALELTRNTVYNIKADKTVGIESIEKIITDFEYCSVDFQISGDIETVPITIIKILEANIREYLTNASKHSQATNIKLKLDIGRKNIRLYYRDNGVGCENINQNLGISGIRERVKNAQGTISIDGKDGFLIVCNLPMKDNYVE